MSAFEWCIECGLFRAAAGHRYCPVCEPKPLGQDEQQAARLRDIDKPPKPTRGRYGLYRRAERGTER